MLHRDLFIASHITIAIIGIIITDKSLFWWSLIGTGT
jgi:hypothetical protein